MCGNSARTDLCGGRFERGVPTANTRARMNNPMSWRPWDFLYAAKDKGAASDVGRRETARLGMPACTDIGNVT